MGAKRDRFRERGKESKKNDQKRRLFSLLPFFMSFFRAFLYFLTRQSLPFLFLTNSKFSLHFAKRFSLRVHTTPRRERYLETQTLQSSHTRINTHAHIKKVRITFSLSLSLSFSFSLHSVLLFFSSATTERDDDDDDSMSLARPHQPFPEIQIIIIPRKRRKRRTRHVEREDTERAIISLHVSFCLRLSLSLCRFSEY